MCVCVYVCRVTYNKQTYTLYYNRNRNERNRHQHQLIISCHHALFLNGFSLPTSRNWSDRQWAHTHTHTHWTMMQLIWLWSRDNLTVSRQILHRSMLVAPPALVDLMAGCLPIEAHLIWADQFLANSSCCSTNNDYNTWRMEILVACVEKQQLTAY